MKLSRIDRIQKVLTVATLFPQLDPATVTSVSVGLLSPRDTPTAATTWTAYSVTAGATTVMFVGSDADSTGAVVVTATADLWAKASGSFGEVEAVLVERIRLLGSAAQIAAPLPIAPVLTVQGRTGTVVLSAADVGADASGAAAAAQTAAATDATTKVNAATTASALDAATATNVNSGAQTSAALRAALVTVNEAPLSPVRYGAVGDGVAIDTVALQDTYDAAAGADGEVWLGRAQYAVDDSVKLRRRGMRMAGQSSWETKIIQTNPAKHAFELQDDPAPNAVQGANNNFSVRIEGLRLEGVGAATAAGHGIHGAFKPGQYNGDFLQCSDVTVYGFSVGCYLDHWAQTSFRDCVIHYNGINLQTGTSANCNTIRLDNTAIARATTVGAQFGAGRGIAITGGDWVEQPKSILVQAFAQVTMLGGNFESPSAGATDAIIDVATNGRFVGVGQGFLRSAGADIPIYRVDAGASLSVNSPANNGFTTLVKKLASTAIVQVVGEDLNLTSTQVVNDSGATTYRPGLLPQRADNAVPAPASGLRGLLLQIMSRDTGTADDALYWYMRQGGSGANYQRRRLDNIIECVGTPEAAVPASIGTIAVRTDAPDISHAVYFKVSGNGNTGWQVLGAAGPSGATGGLQLGDAIGTMWSAGCYLDPPGGTGTSGDLGNGSLYVIPWFVPYNGGTAYSVAAMRLDVIGASTDTGALFRPVIYADNGSNYPGTLLFDGGALGGAGVGQFNMNTAAAQEIAFGASAPSIGDARRIWVGGVIQNAPASRGTVGLAVNLPWSLPTTTAPTSASTRFSYLTNGVTGTPATTFPAGRLTSGNAPRVKLKLA